MKALQLLSAIAFFTATVTAAPIPLKEKKYHQSEIEKALPGAVAFGSGLVSSWAGHFGGPPGAATGAVAGGAVGGVIGTLWGLGAGTIKAITKAPCTNEEAWEMRNDPTGVGVSALYGSMAGSILSPLGPFYGGASGAATGTATKLGLRKLNPNAGKCLQ